MKYCPYCGAGFSDGTVSFCTECGKKLPEEKTVPPEAKEQSKKVAKKQKRKKEKKEKHKKDAKKKKPEKEIPEVMGEAVDDGYDGYYNDVLPPDTDRVKDGLDKELVKKIVALCIGVTVIILMCVALLYIL
jgi:uncharacterized Zn finger protein (UPF0148 family)